LLPWPADASGPSMPRVALEVELTTSSGALRIITTHLEFYSARQRLAQVDAMRARHREACAHADQPAPAENATGPFTATGQARDAIICGDFNSAFDSDAYRRLLEPIADAPSFVDAWVARHPGHTPPPTAGVYDTAQWSDGPLACDFVFVTDTLLPRVTRCEIDGDVRASDHQPVVLEVD
jgi:endonuclease/exonuclease/phosphatase family metal-dependent hydrolase